MPLKGPEAFRTISEVASDLDLPQHVLRFWETRFAQIRPMKRGGGRRYYRPDDIELLRGIRHLLYSEGYTIRGVQRLLREEGPRFVAGAGRSDAATLPAPLASGEEEAPDVDDENHDYGDEAALTVVAPLENPEPPKGTRPSLQSLPLEDVRRLRGTLSELLELKRLLDQARG
jgi:DNA-binding transcriptional MerR regulator